jgi:transcriptional regulator with XRE-family HTH domain
MAQVINGHWTNDSTKAFLFRIAFDFVTQMEQLMDSGGVTPTDLAKRLRVSKGRVSQIMNNPGNMTLKTIVEWARALDMKVAVVAYDDGDVDNDNGPVNPQIFTTCWEKAGRPTDFFSAGMTAVTTSTIEIDPEKWGTRHMRLSSDNLETELEALNITVWQKVEDRGLHAGTESDYVQP